MLLKFHFPGSEYLSMDKEREKEDRKKEREKKEKRERERGGVEKEKPVCLRRNVQDDVGRVSTVRIISSLLGFDCGAASVLLFSLVVSLWVPFP